jgi:two-component system, OmpR family, response regulator ChvI
MSITDSPVASLPELTAIDGTSGAIRIMVVDDDDSFRESLVLSLDELGYDVSAFANGPAALDHLAAGGRADVILLDWRMPGMSGLEVLRNLRQAGSTTPVIFLTALNEARYEEVALEGGAVDFVDKLRRLPFLVKRMQLIAEGVRPAPPSNGRASGDVLHLGRLELRFDINRAIWAGRPIELTLTEFKILALLALRAGEHVSYREIYDVVHGKDFLAGYGEGGYRPNVRTFIKRIRRKLHAVDPAFEHIVNAPGYGYRYNWLAE